MLFGARQKVRGASHQGNSKKQAGLTLHVYKDGSSVWAEDTRGKMIARGKAGADDASVIQRALDYIGNAGGGSIYIHRGEYILKSFKVLEEDKLGNAFCSAIPLPDNTALIGDCAVLKVGDDIPAIPGKRTNLRIITNADLVNGNHNIRIEGLILDGNVGNQSHVNEVEGISLGEHTAKGYVSHASIKDVEIRNCTDGIDFDYVKQSVIDGVIAHDNAMNGIHPSFSSKEITIVNCQVYNCGTIGIYIFDTAHDITVANNRIKNCGQSGITAHGSGLLIIGNVLRDNNTYGIHVRGSDNLISNNVIVAPDKNAYAIYVDNADRLAVIGNVIRMTGTKAYGIYGVKSNSIIVGNRVVSKHAPLVVPSGQSNIFVMSNYFESLGGARIDLGDSEVVFMNNKIVNSGLRKISNAEIKFNKGYATENSGTATVTGDGTTRTFTINIAHGLVKDSVAAHITLDRDGTVDKVYLVDTDADGFKETLRLQVTYATAPADGESVPIYWHAEVVSASRP